MNTLEMTDNELYELGIKILTDKLGASQVPRFIRQIRPGKGDYSVDRHKLLANQPDIDTIVKQIQERHPAREAAERARVKRFAAPQGEIRKMTDIEIYEIGNQVLVDKLGPDGLMGFIMQCQELNGGPRHDRIQSAKAAKRAIKFYTASLRLNPKIVEDYIKRGTAYSYIGKHTKATGDYTAALKLKPNYANAYYKRGVVWLHLKEWERAEADLMTAKNKGADIVGLFHNDYKNIEDFETKNEVMVPEDIAALLHGETVTDFCC